MSSAECKVSNKNSLTYANGSDEASAPSYKPFDILHLALDTF